MAQKHIDKAPPQVLKELKSLMYKIDYLIEVEHVDVKDYIQKRLIDCINNERNRLENETIRRKTK